jgi:hypothetical protein
MEHKTVFRLLALLGAFFTVGAGSFAVSLYVMQSAFDGNLAYMAVYYDDMTSSLIRQNASQDAVAVAASQAVNFCFMLTVEKRELGWEKYRQLCANISRSSNLAGAGLWDIRDEFERTFDSEMEEYRGLYPAVSYVFGGANKMTKCKLGGEEVPCPWDSKTP